MIIDFLVDILPSYATNADPFLRLYAKNNTSLQFVFIFTSKCKIFRIKLVLPLEFPPTSIYAKKTLIK